MNNKRILLINTPDKTNKKYVNMINKYMFYKDEFNKRYVKLITKNQKT